MPTHQADVAVIGAGPGGYVAAIRLAQLGQKVILVEREALGGTCLNWGCIPSKAMIYAASLYEKIHESSLMGILVDNARVDAGKLQGWKNDVVKKLTGGIGQLMKAHGVQVVMGTARFENPTTLSVQNSAGIETVEAKNILIATGSTPVQIPGFAFDGKLILESRDALELTEIPKRLAILGGGVIGLEIGVMYAKLGTQVTVVEALPQLLPGTDPEIVQLLSRSLKKRGLQIHTNTKAKSVEKLGETAIRLTVETPQGESTLEADKLLVSVGRRPNAQGLQVEKVGIKLNEKGFIQVDNQLRTSVPNIFAIGDVTSGPLLAHKASKEGLVAAAVIAGSPEILDVRAMPAAVFTDPEIATVGLTEEEAIQQGHTVKIGKFPFQASGRALSMNEPEGMVKLVADAETDVVLGVHMIGPDVSELIAEATLAIEMGATSEDIALTVHAHPTLPESLMEAAEAVHGKAIHIFQKEKPALVGAK